MLFPKHSLKKYAPVFLYFCSQWDGLSLKSSSKKFDPVVSVFRHPINLFGFGAAIPKLVIFL